MRLFFSRRIPHFHRVLLVESGSRYLFERLLPGIYSSHPELERLDLVTCFPGEPAGFDPGRGEVLRVHLFRGPEGRTLLFNHVEQANYEICGIICSGEPIMTRWKWALAWKAPAKLFILNENGDYFWFDRTSLSTIRHFILFRAGLSGAGAVSTLGRLLLFPFTFAYLLGFAAWVHLRRKVRTI